MKWRRAETPLSTWIAIGAVLLIVLAIGGIVTIPNLGSSNVRTTGANLVTVIKPVQFTCFDALTGSNCGAVTVKLYLGSATSSAESLTASASGVATTGNSYKSGTALTIAVSGNSKVTEYLPFVVPPMDAGSAISSANNVITVYAVTLGGWTISNTGTNGATTFVSGSQYALSVLTGTTTTITTAISETTANNGYKSSYDITNLLNQYLLMQVDDGAGASSGSQYLSITGLPPAISQGNTHYYDVVCPDGLISGFGFTQVPSGTYVQVGSQSSGTSSSQCTGSWSQQTVGTQTFGGVSSFSFTVALGSLASGSVETLSFKLQYYADPAYFAANGNLGPNVAQSGSTFTIKFNK